MQGNGPPNRLEIRKTTGFVAEDKSNVSQATDRRKLSLFLIIATLVVVLDQLTKLWVRANIELGETLRITDRLSLVYVENKGSAFGLFANQAFLIIIIGIASFFIILLLLHYLSPATKLSMLSIGLILGGAAGNLIDRLRLGYVIDFIDFRLWGNFHWPAFNVADAAITIGILVFLYWFFRSGVFRKARE